MGHPGVGPYVKQASEQAARAPRPYLLLGPLGPQGVGDLSFLHAAFDLQAVTLYNLTRRRRNMLLVLFVLFFEMSSNIRERGAKVSADEPASCQV